MERLERRKTLINTATMPSSSATATVTTNVFEAGKYTTVLQKIESRTTCCPANTSPPPPVPPPKPILIVMPCEAGEFPLLVFLHGYLLYNSFYSQLLQHIASHGFIVIAPQWCDNCEVKITLLRSQRKKKDRTLVPKEAMVPRHAMLGPPCNFISKEKDFKVSFSQGKF
ncbi:CHLOROPHYLLASE-2 CHLOROPLASTIC [Salix koriyanagi]|uniref:CHLOROPHYLLASE-2 CHLOROPLASTIC n=1 Tax=Salix koriyanagi TaxID=2511006 RepID=A0A9Q1AHW4_9ROSI|nr:CHLOROPHYLLASE-2 CHLOROPLASTIC [Salix koriyanagi]KAJ6771656.1 CHLOROPHYLLASE-2 CHLOROPLASTIC [Salix koriyanagi]